MTLSWLAIYFMRIDLHHNLSCVYVFLPVRLLHLQGCCWSPFVHWGILVNVLQKFWSLSPVDWVAKFLNEDVFPSMQQRNAVWELNMVRCTLFFLNNNIFVLAIYFISDSDIQMWWHVIERMNCVLRRSNNTI